MRSSVQIEVLDEEEYALEVQREQEEKVRKREEERKRATVATAATAGSSSAAQVAPAHPYARSSGAAASSSSPSPASHWHSLLPPLALPSFLATLHDTRVYDPAAFARQSVAEVHAFQRTATQGWKEMLAALQAAEGQRATVAQLRPLLTPLLCACIRFLLPPLPPTPSPMVPAGDMDVTDSLTSSEPAPPFEFVWQTPQLSALAMQALQKLAQIFKAEANAHASDLPLVAATLPSASDPSLTAVGAAMSDPSLQRFFAWVLPTHLLPFLRSEMRSGAGVPPAPASNAPVSLAADNPTGTEWKGVSHFPAPFFVCFLCAYLVPQILAAHLRSLLALLLPLVDDHEVHFKVAGLAALQRLVRVVPALHFGEGWGAVLLRSMQTALSFRETAILALAVPTYVQTYMALFPPVLLHDESVIQQLQSVPDKSASPHQRGVLQSQSASGAVALQERVAAQDAMLTALLRELSYLSLSPSPDNLFATFAYAQAMLPVLLYVGPLGAVRHLSSLLPIVLQWCTQFVAPVQRRVSKLGWECVEAMLCMRVIGERMAEAHMGRLVEACAQGWITEQQFDSVLEASTTSSRKASIAGAPRPAPAALRSDAIPLSAPDFHLRYSSERTIAHIVLLLRSLDAGRFEPIWTELRGMEELAGLAQAVETKQE